MSTTSMREFSVGRLLRDATILLLLVAALLCVYMFDRTEPAALANIDQSAPLGASTPSTLAAWNSENAAGEPQADFLGSSEPQTEPQLPDTHLAQGALPAESKDLTPVQKNESAEVAPSPPPEDATEGLARRAETNPEAATDVLQDEQPDTRLANKPRDETWQEERVAGDNRLSNTAVPERTLDVEKTPHPSASPIVEIEREADVGDEEPFAGNQVVEEVNAVPVQQPKLAREEPSITRPPRVADIRLPDSGAVPETSDRSRVEYFGPQPLQETPALPQTEASETADTRDAVQKLIDNVEQEQAQLKQQVEQERRQDREERQQEVEKMAADVKAERSAADELARKQNPKKKWPREKSRPQRLENETPNSEQPAVAEDSSQSRPAKGDFRLTPDEEQLRKREKERRNKEILKRNLADRAERAARKREEQAAQETTAAKQLERAIATQESGDLEKARDELNKVYVDYFGTQPAQDAKARLKQVEREIAEAQNAEAERESRIREQFQKQERKKRDAELARQRAVAAQEERDSKRSKTPSDDYWLKADPEAEARKRVMEKAAKAEQDQAEQERLQRRRIERRKRELQNEQRRKAEQQRIRKEMRARDLANKEERAQKQKEEAAKKTAAAEELKRAIATQESGDLEKARDELNKVYVDYFGTQAADEAKTRLDQVEKKIAEAENAKAERNSLRRERMQRLERQQKQAAREQERAKQTRDSKPAQKDFQIAPKAPRRSKPEADSRKPLAQSAEMLRAKAEEKQKLDKARRELEKFQKDKREEDRRKEQQRIERQKQAALERERRAAGLLDRANAAFEAGRMPQARDLFRKIVEDYAGTESATKARPKLNEIQLAERRQRIADEKKAREEAAKRREAQAAESLQQAKALHAKKKLEMAHAKLKTLINDFAGTQAAQQAKPLRDAIAKTLDERRKQQAAREKAAADKLAAAKRLQKIGKTEAALEEFRQIVKDFAGTPSAKEAQGYLPEED